ncbi:unnamed protein product, partial [Effrenium voratum]
ALLFSSKELQSEALSFRACLKACMAANQEDVTLRLLRHGPAPTLSKRDVEALVLQAPSCSLALELLSRRCSAKACSLLLQRWHRQREIAMSVLWWNRGGDLMMLRGMTRADHICSRNWGGPLKELTG